MTNEANHTFVAVKQVAARYGVSVATVWRWSQKDDFPRPIKLGANVTRWALADLEAWEQSQKEVS